MITSYKRLKLIRFFILTLIVMMSLSFVSCGKSKTFTIKFDSDGGSEVSSQTVNKNEKVAEPENPIKEGYVFLGWYNGSVIYDFQTKVTKDLTLTAKWEKENQESSEKESEKESINAESQSEEHNSSNESQDSEDDQSEESSLEEASEQESVEIESQSESSSQECGSENESQSENDSQESIESQESNFQSESDESLESIVQSESDESLESSSQESVVVFEVLFIVDGEYYGVSQFVERGKTVIAPQNPEKDGYEFTGWYFNGDLYDFSSVVESNIVLVAGWEEISQSIFTVSFNTDGGNLIESQSVTENQQVAIPDQPEKEGFVFICWMIESQEFNFDLPITCDIELVARWEEIKPIDVFIGEWSGDGTDYQDQRIVVTIETSTSGTIKIADGFANYSINYQIVSVCHYADKLRIEYLQNGTTNYLYFVVGENELVYNTGLNCNGFILTKTS